MCPQMWNHLLQTQIEPQLSRDQSGAHEIQCTRKFSPMITSGIASTHKTVSCISFKYERIAFVQELGNVYSS